MFQKLQHSLKALRNILLCKYYRLTRKLDYPNSILPKTSYKPIINIDALIKNQSVCLIRRSDKIFEDTFNQLGGEYTLKEDVISYSDVPNLSINLLGGLFEDKHIKYKASLKEPAGKKWDGMTEINLAEHVNGYVVVENFCAIYIHANNIHDITVPYKRPIDKELDKFFKAFEIEPIKEENNYILDGKTKVIHDPINLNYWHVEFKILNFEQGEIKDTKATWKKEYSKQVLKDIIAANAFPAACLYNSIPISFYIN